MMANPDGPAHKPGTEGGAPGARKKTARPVLPRRRDRPIVPVALLVEGRRCLVVGGGRVAGRKAETLLDAGAAVTLIAPEFGEAAARLAERKGVRLIRRAWRARDLERGLFIVITATDDPTLNRRILGACRRRGLLCACPDRGWKDGDLISPASFRHDGLTVSISTGGAACRLSRLIRDSLGRRAGALGPVDLLSVTIDRAAGDADPRPTSMAGRLSQILGLHEFAWWTDGRRTELVALAAASADTVRFVKRTLGADSRMARARAWRGAVAFRLLALRLARRGDRERVLSAVEASRRNGWSTDLLAEWIDGARRAGAAGREAGVHEPGGQPRLREGRLAKRMIGEYERVRARIQAGA